MDETQTLSSEQTEDALHSTGFTHLRRTLAARFETEDFTRAAAFVARIAELAEAANHHPDVALGYGLVGVTLSSHDAGGVTDRDVRLARQIAQAAESFGATAQDTHPAQYEIAIDTLDAAAIREFWRIALGYEESPVGEGEIELVDPRGVGPTVWFQDMGIARTERNRIHLDVYVPTAEAAERVEQVLEAGGRLVTDEFAPEWWVLADAEGNELCICTSKL